MLWATSGRRRDWHDTLGRTFGRHTSFRAAQDGGILGMGGKNSNIDKFMPRAISHDGGKTYEMSKTPFSQLNSGQRPSLLRLRERPAFHGWRLSASKNGTKPDSDQGGWLLRGALRRRGKRTWRIKRLPGAFSQHRGWPSVGYSVARQAPNGLIHLINHAQPSRAAFRVERAWILSDATFADNDATMERSAATKVAAAQPHTENFADGTPHITWSSGLGDDGRVLLHGTETWFYPGGSKQREANLPPRA